MFLIAESGFDPYAAVVITRGDVRCARTATRSPTSSARCATAGARYLDDPAPANALMGGLNKEMDAETFRLGAEAQAPLIEDAFTKQHGLGAMSLERWTTLAKQLSELELLDGTPKPAECFAEIDPVELPLKPLSDAWPARRARSWSRPSPSRDTSPRAAVLALDVEAQAIDVGSRRRERAHVLVETCDRGRGRGRAGRT